jgi:F0F1-type ATP synthase membrane subunit b/b'
VTEPAKANISERIGDIKKQVAGRDMGVEQAQEMLKKIRQIREKLKNDRKDRARKR